MLPASQRGNCERVESIHFTKHGDRQIRHQYQVRYHVKAVKYLQPFSIILLIIRKYSSRQLTQQQQHHHTYNPPSHFKLPDSRTRNTQRHIST